MPLQRACDAEKQVRNSLSNGPLRAQSKEGCGRQTAGLQDRNRPSILRRCRQTSFAGDMFVSC